MLATVEADTQKQALERAQLIQLMMPEVIEEKGELTAQKAMPGTIKEGRTFFEGFFEMAEPLVRKRTDIH